MDEAGLTPLSLLIAQTSPAKIEEVRLRLGELPTSELIHRSTTAFVKKSRVTAFVLAMELTNRGIAPFFRRPDLGTSDSSFAPSIDHEYDLLVQDLLWLSTKGPDQQIMAGTSITWESDSWHALFRRADSLFWLGNRPIWLIVKKLKLTERQQWECKLLKSMPMKHRARGLNQSAQRIYGLLAATLPAIMRTGTDEVTAHAILRKRKRLWYCAEMCGWSPTESARLYQRMTGDAVTKSHVANQLSKILKFRRRRVAIVDDENYEYTDTPCPSTTEGCGV